MKTSNLDDLVTPSLQVFLRIYQPIEAPRAQILQERLMENLLFELNEHFYGRQLTILHSVLSEPFYLIGSFYSVKTHHE